MANQCASPCRRWRSSTFDTLKFAEKLIAAGMPEAPANKAKAEASALSEVLKINFRDIVAKEHLGYWVLGLALAQSGLLVGIFLGWRRQFAGQVRKDLGLGN